LLVVLCCVDAIGGFFISRRAMRPKIAPGAVDAGG
jgi:uncharacterized protein YneF (UPF0154 family)